MSVVQPEPYEPSMVEPGPVFTGNLSPNNRSSNVIMPTMAKAISTAVPKPTGAAIGTAIGAGPRAG